MKYRKLGKTDFNVSEIGFGAWAIGGSWGAQKETDSIERTAARTFIRQARSLEHL